MTQNYLCPEGVLHLPDNARAQTINIITLANGQKCEYQPRLSGFRCGF